MGYEETKAREDKAQELKQYIGDFYEGHAANDREKQDAALKKIQTALFTGDSDSEPFKDYFNEVFSGRTAFNTLLSINDYPKESILRDLLQNTFGCHYETKDIKVLLDAVKGTEYSIAFQLGVLGLRRSEVCALTLADLNDNILTINKAKVKGLDGKWILRNFA